MLKYIFLRHETMHLFTVRYQWSTHIYFFFYCRSTANWQQTVEAGLLFPAFQIMTSRTGWLTLAIGGTTVKLPQVPFINTDMISPAFCLVRGSEFKVTRSDDPSHTPLLLLGEQTLLRVRVGQRQRNKNHAQWRPQPHPSVTDHR